MKTHWPPSEEAVEQLLQDQVFAYSYGARTIRVSRDSASAVGAHNNGNSTALRASERTALPAIPRQFTRTAMDGPSPEAIALFYRSWGCVLLSDTRQQQDQPVEQPADPACWCAAQRRWTSTADTPDRWLPASLRHLRYSRLRRVAARSGERALSSTRGYDADAQAAVHNLTGVPGLQELSSG